VTSYFDCLDSDGQPGGHQRNHEELEGSIDDPVGRRTLSRKSRMCKIHPGINFTYILQAAFFGKKVVFFSFYVPKVWV